VVATIVISQVRLNGDRKTAKKATRREQTDGMLVDDGLHDVKERVPGGVVAGRAAGRKRILRRRRNAHNTRECCMDSRSRIVERGDGEVVERRSGGGG
jgi:hypothetical protein